MLLLPLKATCRGVQLLFEPPFLGRSLPLLPTGAGAAAVGGGKAGAARILDPTCWLLELFGAALLLHKEVIPAAAVEDLFASLFAAARVSWSRHRSAATAATRLARRRPSMQRQHHGASWLPAAAVLLLQLLRCYAGETSQDYRGPLLQQSSQQQCRLRVWEAATATAARGADGAARGTIKPVQVSLDSRCLCEGPLNACLAAAAPAVRGPRSLAAAVLLLSSSCADPAPAAIAAAPAAQQLWFTGDEETAKNLESLISAEGQEETTLVQELQIHLIESLLLFKPLLPSSLPAAPFLCEPPLLRVGGGAAAAQPANAAAASTSELPPLQLHPLTCGTASLGALQQSPVLLQYIYSSHYDSSVQLITALVAAGDAVLAAAAVGSFAATASSPPGTPFPYKPTSTLSSSSRCGYLRWMYEACCFLTNLKFAAAALPLHAWVTPSHWGVSAAPTEVWGPTGPCSLGCASWLAVFCLLRAATKAVQQEQQQQHEDLQFPQERCKASPAAAAPATAAASAASATAAATDDWCCSNEQAGEQQEVFWLLLLDTLHLLQRNGWPCPPCCSRAYGSCSSSCPLETFLLLLKHGGSSSGDKDWQELAESFAGESPATAAAAAAGGTVASPEADLSPSLIILSEQQLKLMLLPLLRLLVGRRRLSLPLILPAGLHHHQQRQQQRQQQQQRSAFESMDAGNLWAFVGDSYTSSSTLESGAAARLVQQQQQRISPDYGTPGAAIADAAATGAAAAAALSFLPSQYLVLRWLLQSVVIFSFAPAGSSVDALQQQQGRDRAQQGLNGTVAVLALLHDFAVGGSNRNSRNRSSSSSNSSSLIEQHVYQLLPLCDGKQTHRLLPMALCLSFLQQREASCSTSTANNMPRLLQVLAAASLLLASDCLLALLQPVSPYTLNRKRYSFEQLDSTRPLVYQLLDRALTLQLPCCCCLLC